MIIPSYRVQITVNNISVTLKIDTHFIFVSYNNRCFLMDKQYITSLCYSMTSILLIGITYQAYIDPPSHPL